MEILELLFNMVGVVVVVDLRISGNWNNNVRYGET